MLILAALLEFLSHQVGWILFVVAVLVGVGVGAADMGRFRWRRVSAVSEVVIIEAWRRKIWLVTPIAFLGVVVVSQLQKSYDEQDAIRQTIKFCVFATGLVVAMTTIILACTNLPREIENRVIYTVATKPTTRLEIVLGKVWGFAKVSFLILLIMGTLTWGYMSLREWNLRKAIATRLSGSDVSTAASSDTLKYYRDAGLLFAKKQEEPDALQIFARLPEETGPRRYFFGGGEGTVQVGFDIDAGAITPPGSDKPAPDGLLVAAMVGYVKKGATTQPAATAPAPAATAATAAAQATTQAATTGPTTVPYYGPFVMSPEQRAKIMAGVTGPALEPTIGIDLVDANHETVGGATPIGPVKVIELTNRNGLSQVQALISPKLTETLKSGRYYIRVTGQSDVEYYVDLQATPEPVKLIVAQANGQLAEIQPIRNPRDETQPAVPIFGTRSGSFGEQLRGGKDHAPTAVYRFRDAAVRARDGKAPLEFRAGIERSGSDAPEDFAGPTEVAVRVKKIGGKPDDAAAEQVIRPESNRPIVFTVPADIVADGNFDVQMRTLTAGDFVGLKPNSLVLVTATQPFAWNLLKSMLILWLMSILITTIAIFTSTFLSWPIAVVFTLVILLGHWGVEQLGDALQPGIGAQVVTDMGIKDPAKAKAFQASIEKLSWALNAFSSILPDISKYAAVEDIERGISIPWVKMREALGVTLGFGLPLVLLSYVVLKNKEVAP
jgi:ABC-type transport system involved in multi-copper enzyme maturation permease subunit